MGGGPPSGDDFKKMKSDREAKGFKGGFNGGCAETLCCGHVLEYGVWKDEYVCYD